MLREQDRKRREIGMGQQLASTSMKHIEFWCIHLLSTMACPIVERIAQLTKYIFICSDVHVANVRDTACNFALLQSWELAHLAVADDAQLLPRFGGDCHGLRSLTCWPVRPPHTDTGLDTYENRSPQRASPRSWIIWALRGRDARLHKSTPARGAQSW